MSPHPPKWKETYVFGVEPVGINVNITFTVTLLCCHNISTIRWQILIDMDITLAGWVVTWFLLGYTVRKNGGLLSTPMF